MKQVQQFLEQIDGLRVHLRPVDEGHLKYLSVVLMLIDHIACMFLERVYLPDGRPLMYSLSYGTTIDGILRAIGRQPFPIFCYFLVEGFMKTSSRGRYLLRLSIFAVLSQYPFQKGIFPRSADFHGSVFCTLLIGMLSIWVIEAMGKISDLQEVRSICASLPLFPSAVSMDLPGSQSCCTRIILTGA